MAIRDHATEVSFEPKQNSHEICFLISDEIYELVPPPSWLYFQMTQTVKAIAGLDLATCDRRQEGHIDVTSGGHHVPTDTVVEPTEFGQRSRCAFLPSIGCLLVSTSRHDMSTVEPQAAAQLADAHTQGGT